MSYNPTNLTYDGVPIEGLPCPVVVPPRTGDVPSMIDKAERDDRAAFRRELVTQLAVAWVRSGSSYIYGYEGAPHKCIVALADAIIAELEKDQCKKPSPLPSTPAQGAEKK